MNASVVPISTADDPRLVEIRDLNDPAARRRTDAEHGCYIIEGLTALEATLDAGATIRHVVVDDHRLDRVVAALGDRAVTVYVTPRSVLQSAAGFPFHRGVLGVGDRPALAPVDSVLAAAHTEGRPVLAVEGVTDHENVGALFRNAAAFGVGGVVVDPTCADPLYRRAIRVSVGHVLTTPWTRGPEGPELVAALQAAGFRVAALSPAGLATVDDLVDASVGERGHRTPVAWLVGAEGAGLRADTLAAADVAVSIPMANGVDSLNVATTVAVALALHRDRTRPGSR